jgi:single-stranded DNA-binding protein
MVNRKWEDKDGNTRYSTELVAEGWDGVIAPAPAPETKKGGGQKKAAKKAADFEDEIPFAWVMTIGVGFASLLAGVGQYVA